MTHQDTYCIEVHRDDACAYNIPGAATAEDWESVKAEMDTIGPQRPLKGWGRWERCFRCVDEWGGVRWYFVSDQQLCSHCLSAGQDASEAGLATIQAYWVDADGTGDGVCEICSECYLAGDGQVPGYVLAGDAL